jgi:hypothetical protein
MLHPSTQPNTRKQFLCPTPRLRNTLPCNSQRHHHVFKSREFAEKVVKLKHETD